MRILLLSSAYNSLTQRVHAELADGGHQVPVELALGDEAMRQAVRRHDPDLVIAPMLTVLQANAEMDAGDIWASAEFALPPGCSKSSLYRTEVADAALEAVLAAVARFASGGYRPEPLE